MRTKTLNLFLVLAVSSSAGCVMGDFYLVGSKCDGDVLQECERKKGCVDITDCQKEHGVGCVMDVPDQPVRCGQVDTRCAGGIDAFCISGSEVAHCGSGGDEVIEDFIYEITTCLFNEVCQESDSEAECVSDGDGGTDTV